MNNRDTVTELPHPQAVSLAPSAAAETGTSTAPGLAPPCCPSMGQEGVAPPVLLQDAPIHQLPAPRTSTALPQHPRHSASELAAKITARGEEASHGHRATGMGPGAESTHIPKDPYGQNHVSGCSSPSEPHSTRVTATHPAHAAPPARVAGPQSLRDAGSTPASAALSLGCAGCSGRGVQPPASIACPLPGLGSAQEPPGTGSRAQHPSPARRSVTQQVRKGPPTPAPLGPPCPGHVLL